MSLLRVQGLIFCLLAVVCALSSAFLPPLDQPTELILAASLIIVLGVPHGALDTVFAKELYGVSTAAGWMKFSAVYLTLAGLAVALWFLAPVFFLAAFIGISIAHFSADPDGKAGWLLRILYGGAIVFIPAVSHPQAVKELFRLLAGPNSDQVLSPLISQLALPWLVMFGIATLFLLARRSPLGAEFLGLGLVACFAPPLISFTVYFCGMHSARHILRTAAFAKTSRPVLLLGAMLLPMLGVLALASLAWILLEGRALDVKVVQIVFVGLAALTVPHMALVERVRQRLTEVRLSP